jgi:hypothetical protein
MTTRAEREAEAAARAALEAAAVEWIAAKQALDRPEVKAAKAKLERAAKVLKPWFHETGHGSLEVDTGTIGYTLGWSTVLDQEKVRAELGKRISFFEKQQERETLTLLGQRA